MIIFNRKIRKRQRNTIVVIMTVTVAIILMLVSVVVVHANSLGNGEKELQLVHVIMRHGIRTPADTYPNDPHINATLYPIGWGQLTNEGKMQLYNVGQFLRDRYGAFLTAHYSPDDYYTQSTDVDRTKASMQLVNAGLWPPQKEQKWGPLDWQPVPVHSEPLSQDMLLLVRKPCAMYHKERDQVVASAEIQKMLKDNEDLFKELTTHTGKEIKDFDDVQDVFSTLKAEEGINLTLPEWTQDYYPNKMLEPTIFSFILNTYNDKMNRLKGGLLLKKMISDWTSKKDGTLSPTTRKAFLYGGHDSTIVNIMRALKVWDPQFPDYAITILLELKKDNNNNLGLEIYLRNSTLVPPHQLTIPGCDQFCPLDQLLDLTKDVIPENWEEECRTDDENYTVPPAGGP